MDEKLQQLYRQLAERGLSPEQERRILLELNDAARHELPADDLPAGPTAPGGDHLFANPVIRNPYEFDDLTTLQTVDRPKAGYHLHIRSLDELLERDRQREKDGFPRKIRVGRLIKPGRGGREKIVVVPSTVEEKLLHDRAIRPESDEDASGGTGPGEEGEVIGEEPVRPSGGAGAGSGEGQQGPHEIESSAYDLGKILTEKFALPNLKDKGKKRSLTHYSYDLTDRHRGHGQHLDKKATLRRVIETNIHLGNIPDRTDIDPSKLLIAPNDWVYRVLSKEMDFESQAMVFFLRDYSASMDGKPTETVVTQHVMIYSWLLYQYAHQVETRFILHDTEASEVDDFYSYYNSKVAGGTHVASAFRLVNEIVEKENLAQDYNIYVFHGTDGDDWDTEGKEVLPEMQKMLTYANRVGITVARHHYDSGEESTVEKYMNESKLLEEQSHLIRMDVLAEDADEPRLIEGIKRLISESPVAAASD